MENSDKVSIIVPIYNVEPFLERCLESIINQSYKNLEILLVDDGSNDGSEKIADNFLIKDERIRVIHKKNTGVSDTRNVGIKNATGEYICFADADDYLKPDYVEYLLSMITRHDADISLTTQMFGNFDPKKQSTNISEVCLGPEETTIELLAYNIPIGVYCKMFRRKFLEENKVAFRKKFYIGEGFNFNADAFQRAKKVVLSNRKIYYYRRDNPTSATTLFSIDKWKNGLDAVQNIKKNFIIHTDNIEKAWEFAWWRTNSDVYDVMVLAGAQKEYSEFYKKCRKIVRTRAYSAFKVPASQKNKKRALVMMFVPRVIPFMMELRRKKYHAELKK